MAPIKFEEHLKEKLEKRTIQPSSGAWNTLSDRLDKHGKNQTNRGYWWLGIAASITGIVLVSWFVFNNSNTKTLKPVIVDTPVIEELQQDKVTSNEVEMLPTETIDNPKPMDKSTKTSITKAKTQKQNPNFNPVNIAKEEALASNVGNEEDKAENAMNSPALTTDYEAAKLNDVVAEIKRLQSQNNVVSEREIDSLLKQAERDILKHRIYNENSKTVDANALLQDVETDLEQSFRTRVFEALLNNYETVKTAVANRNN